jgi:hypothetical protein
MSFVIQDAAFLWDGRITGRARNGPRFFVDIYVLVIHSFQIYLGVNISRSKWSANIERDDDWGVNPSAFRPEDRGLLRPLI